MKQWDCTTNIEFFGISNKRSAERYSLFKNAASFFVSSLFKNPSKIYFDIYLTTLKNATGWCVPQERDFFLVEINKNKVFYEQILTLAHELVHCKQFFYKELYEKDSIIYWKKKPYYNDVYEEQPWEIEAFTKEQILVEDFINLGYYNIIDDRSVNRTRYASRKTIFAESNTPA